jgi:LacI family transcriptional regulator
MADDVSSLAVGFFCDTAMVGSGYFGMLQIGLMAGCRKWDTALLIKSFDLADPDLSSQVRTHLRRTPLRGVILPEPICEMPVVLEAVAEAGLPVVRIAPHSEACNTLDICIDNKTAAHDLTNYLIELGHKRIAFIKGPPEHGDAKARLAGFNQAMAEAGLVVEDSLCLPGGFDFAQGVAASERLLAIDPLPTAVFACNDEVAAAVVATAHRLGHKIPDEFSLAGFDDSPLARTIWPQLTTCRQKMELTGYMAVDFLIEPPATAEARKRPLQHELVIRQSTARLKS